MLSIVLEAYTAFYGDYFGESNTSVFAEPEIHQYLNTQHPIYIVCMYSVCITYTHSESTMFGECTRHEQYSFKC